MTLIGWADRNFRFPCQSSSARRPMQYRAFLRSFIWTRFTKDVINEWFTCSSFFSLWANQFLTMANECVMRICSAYRGMNSLCRANWQWRFPSLCLRSVREFKFCECLWWVYKSYMTIWIVTESNRDECVCVYSGQGILIRSARRRMKEIATAPPCQSRE